jgi:hypothetical protein
VRSCVNMSSSRAYRSSLFVSCSTPVLVIGRPVKHDVPQENLEFSTDFIGLCSKKGKVVPVLN